MSEYTEDTTPVEIDHDRVLTVECAVVIDRESGLPGDDIKVYCHERGIIPVMEWLGQDWHTTGRKVCPVHALEISAQQCDYCGAKWDGYQYGTGPYLGLMRTHDAACPAFDDGEFPAYTMVSPTWKQVAEPTRSDDPWQDAPTDRLKAVRREPHPAQVMAIESVAVWAEKAGQP